MVDEERQLAFWPLDEIRAALAWYSEEKQWEPRPIPGAHGQDTKKNGRPITEDKGRRARAALQLLREAEARHGVF